MFAQKLKLYAAIGWGMLVLFSFLGALMRKPAAPYVLFIVVIMWGSIRIINEAFASVQVLRLIKTLEKAPKEGDEPKDDGDV